MQDLGCCVAEALIWLCVWLSIKVNVYLQVGAAQAGHWQVQTFLTARTWEPGVSAVKQSAWTSACQM